MPREDILRDKDGLIITDGDLAVGNTGRQHLEDLFGATMGEYKEHPEVGLGAVRYLKKKDIFLPEFLRDWRLQLQNDGYENADISFDIETGKMITDV